MKLLRNTFLTAASLAGWSMLTSEPAYATIAQNLPEPTTMSLIAAGVAGVVVAARLRRRK